MLPREISKKNYALLKTYIVYSVKLIVLFTIGNTFILFNYFQNMQILRQQKNKKNTNNNLFNQHNYKHEF